SLNPIREAAVEGRFVLAIVRDVTERTKLRLELEKRLRDIETLYRADEVLHRSLRLDDVLQGLVDLAADILQADKSSVLVWDANDEFLVPGATRGFRPQTLARMRHARGDGILGCVAVSGRPMAIEDASTDPRVFRQITEPEGIRSFAHVPIKANGDVIGVFSVNYCQLHKFTNDEERMLEALAQRAALAMENARLYERAQQVAVLEERQRLARELHDAVTQTLFAASLVAEALPRLWQKSRQQGEQSLSELRRLTWGALAEMRTLLLELRPTALTEAPLSEL